MKKYKRGISLLVLGITILVMIILSGIVVMEVRGKTINTKKLKFASEMNQVKQSFDLYCFRKDSFPVYGSVKINLNDIESENLEQFSGEPMDADRNIELLAVDLNKLEVGESVLGNGKSLKDYYAYSIVTKKIYYLEGKTIANIKYYTLTEELYDMLGMGTGLVS